MADAKKADTRSGSQMMEATRGGKHHGVAADAGADDSGESRKKNEQYKVKQRAIIGKGDRKQQCAHRSVEVAPEKTGESHQRQRPWSSGA